jgi:hypothetical protein
MAWLLRQTPSEDVMAAKPKDTATFTNTAQDAVLKDINKRLAAGEDVFGDEEWALEHGDPEAIAAAQAATELAKAEQEAADEAAVSKALNGDDEEDAPEVKPEPKPKPAAKAAPKKAAAKKPVAKAAAPEPEQETEQDSEEDEDGEEVADEPVAEAEEEEVGETMDAVAQDEQPEPVAVVASPVEPTIAEAEADFVAPLPPGTRTPQQLAARRAELETEAEKAFDDHDEGALSRKEYHEKMRPINQELSRLTREEAVIEMHGLAVRAYEERVLNKILAAGKKAGLDYSDQEAADEFDASLNMLFKSKSSAGKSFSEIANKAHKMVMGLHGKLDAPAPAPAPKVAAVLKKVDKTPPARQNVQAPMSLRNIPAAAASSGGTSAFDTLAPLTGQDYQEAYRRAPKDALQRWMDS